MVEEELELIKQAHKAQDIKLGKGLKDKVSEYRPKVKQIATKDKQFYAFLRQISKEPIEVRLKQEVQG